MFGTKVAAPPPDKLTAELVRRGPHKVDRGDLGIVGMSGEIYVPRVGKGLPAVAFGHDWMVHSNRYRDLAYHLASWGIVVAIPDAQTGVFASDIELATDLRAAVTVLQRVQLGDGSVTVDPTKVGLAGHGFGAAAATRAASSTTTLLGRPPVDIGALAAVFPSPTTPDLRAEAEKVSVPTLTIAAADQLDSMTDNALPLARLFGGKAVLRTIADADSRGLLERPSLASLVGVNGADKTTHRAVRVQLTGYLLHVLGKDARYAAFADPQVTIGASVATVLDETDDPALDHVSQLLGSKPPKPPKESRGAGRIEPAKASPR